MKFSDQQKTVNTRNNDLGLKHRFRETSTEENDHFCIRPTIWNRIPEFLRKKKKI